MFTVTRVRKGNKTVDFINERYEMKTSHIDVFRMKSVLDDEKDTWYHEHIFDTADEMNNYYKELRADGYKFIDEQVFATYDKVEEYTYTLS